MVGIKTAAQRRNGGALALLVALLGALVVIVAPVGTAVAAPGDYTVSIDGPASVGVHTPFTYSVTLSTPEASAVTPANGIVLTMQLPPGLAYSSVPTGGTSPVQSASYNGTTHVLTLTMSPISAVLSSFVVSVTQVNDNVKDPTTVLTTTITGTTTPSGTTPTDSAATSLTGAFEYAPTKSATTIAGSDNRLVTYFFNVYDYNWSSGNNTFTTWAQQLVDVLPAGAVVTASSTALGTWTITGTPATGQTATWVNNAQFGPTFVALDQSGAAIWLSVLYPVGAFPTGSPPPANQVALSVRDNAGTWHNTTSASAQGPSLGTPGPGAGFGVDKSDPNGNDAITAPDALLLPTYLVRGSLLSSGASADTLILTDAASSSAANTEFFAHTNVAMIQLRFNPSLIAAAVPYTVEYQTYDLTSGATSAWQTFAQPAAFADTGGGQLGIWVQNVGSAGYNSAGGINATLDLPTGQVLNGWRVVLSPSPTDAVVPPASEVRAQIGYYPLAESYIDGSLLVAPATNVATAEGALTDGTPLPQVTDDATLNVTRAVTMITSVVAPASLVVGSTANYVAQVSNVNLQTSYAGTQMRVVLPEGVFYDASVGATRANTSPLGTTITTPDVGSGVTVTTETVTDPGDGSTRQVVVFTFDDPLPPMRPLGEASHRAVEGEGFKYNIPVTVVAQAYDPANTTATVRSYATTTDPAFVGVPYRWGGNYFGADVFNFDTDPARPVVPTLSANSQVVTAGGLLIGKLVHATAADPLLTTAEVTSPGTAEWRVSVTNVLPNPVDSTVLFDRLPAAGDGRSSGMDLTLSGAVTGAPAGSTVEYSVDATSASTGTWTSSPTGARAVRVTIPTIAAGSSFTLVLPTTVPSGHLAGVAAVNDVQATASYQGSAVNFASNEATATIAAAPSLTIDKQLDGATVAAAPGPDRVVGSALAWTYTVTNTGNTYLDDVAVADAATNGDGSTSTLTPASTDSGLLAPGTTRTFTATSTATTGQYHNVATASAEAVDAAGTAFAAPVTPATDEAWYVGIVRRYTATKTSDPAPGATIDAGQVVHYTLTVSNVGTVPVTATLNDDLARVLDDATYNNDVAVSGSATQTTMSGTVLSWSGTLAPGDIVAITYSVTVKPYDQQGDHRLLNLLTTPGDTTTDCTTAAGGCPVDNPVNPPPTTTTQPPATTTLPTQPTTPPGGLPWTGADFTSALAAALLFVTAGAISLFMARRRGRNAKS